MSAYLGTRQPGPMIRIGPPRVRMLNGEGETVVNRRHVDFGPFVGGGWLKSGAFALPAPSFGRDSGRWGRLLILDQPIIVSSEKNIVVMERKRSSDFLFILTVTFNWLF